VSGAGRGIGRPIALRLAELGADVRVNYWHREDGAKEVVAEVERRGRRGILLPGDVAEERVVEETVAKMTSTFGRIDFLVNNTGGSGGAKTDNPIDEAVVGDWNRVLSVNLTAEFLAPRAVAPVMLRQRSGRVRSTPGVVFPTQNIPGGGFYARARLIEWIRAERAVWTTARFHLRGNGRGPSLAR
jgi:3-oxoacyl-[acyl-carrier protein] reductase